MDRGTWWTPVHGDIIEVIERVHTTGWFMQNHLFPTLLEAGKSQTKELTDSVPTENPVTSLQDEPQAGIKIVGRNINNLRYADVFMISHVQLFAPLWTVASLSMGFSRQEYWSGLPFPTPQICR